MADPDPDDGGQLAWAIAESLRSAGTGGPALPPPPSCPGGPAAAPAASRPPRQLWFDAMSDTEFRAMLGTQTDGAAASHQPASFRGRSRLLPFAIRFQLERHLVSACP